LYHGKSQTETNKAYKASASTFILVRLEGW
jgi:hypothetical protein